MADKLKELTLREKLNLIDTWLCEGSDEDRVGLAAILSAIRGPDCTGDDWKVGESVKNETTNVIRRKAFPQAWARSNYNQNGSSYLSSRTGWDTSETAAEFVRPSPDERKVVGTHFTSHVNEAAKALKLKIGVKSE